MSEQYLGARVIEAEKTISRLHRRLAYATEFDVEGVRVYSHGEVWMTNEQGHVVDHPDQKSALDWAYEIRNLEFA